MKVGITVDDVKSTQYRIGKFDFLTRQVELDPDLAAKLSLVQDVIDATQRILASAYATQGKFILASDLEILECLDVAVRTPEAKSAGTPKKQATAQGSSKASQKA